MRPHQGFIYMLLTLIPERNRTATRQEFCLFICFLHELGGWQMSLAKLQMKVPPSYVYLTLNLVENARNEVSN
jgi:hypothetical protein